MKLSALIPSTDRAVKLRRVIGIAKRAGADEIIVSARPGLRTAAQQLGVTVVRSGKNRAQDYNAAARAAHGDILVFIHQNTRHFPRTLFSDMKRALHDPDTVGGGINIAFDHSSPLLAVVAFLSNYYRMRLRRVPYCDQTIFVRRSVFEKMVGFRNMPVFEDTDFARRLRKKGRLAFLKGPVVTSAHRFLRDGIIRQIVRNQLLKLLYHLGVPPKALKRIYEAPLRL